MELELEPEVEEWVAVLRPASFATVAFHLDRLVELGSALRMPHSRSLGGGLFELRFDLERKAQRITYFFPGEQRIVLLTVFRKQRMNERIEIERARRVMARCAEERHTAEDG
jgi:phage-related protein